jgi:hypothetical protein
MQGISISVFYNILAAYPVSSVVTACKNWNRKERPCRVTQPPPEVVA